MKFLSRNCFLLLIIIFITSSCFQSSEPIIEKNRLQGAWSEDFLWKNYSNCFGDSCGIERTSTIFFYDNNFELTISPSHYKYVLDSTLIRVNVDDTLYFGSYQSSGDTLYFNILNKGFRDTIIFSIDNSTLNLSQKTKQFTVDGDTTFVIRTSSFLWAESWMKPSGSFIKEE